MHFGVLGFSYAGFNGAEASVRDRGAFSANLGDAMQALAVRQLYRDLGVPDSRVVRVDRDTLTTYDGPPVVLPLNGCFYDWHFPLSPKVTPLFIGFQARRAVVQKIAPHLKQLATTIGCRDRSTAISLAAEGIEATVTGCLTFSLPHRQSPPKRGKVLIVHGAGSGALPGLALKKMPRRLLMNAEFISQRREMTAHPLSDAQMAEQETIAAALLRDYQDQARLIITPLHHVAAPCIASGIPTVVIRQDWDERFSFMDDIIPVHLFPFADEIDWEPEAADITAIRDSQKARFAEALRPYWSP